MSLHKSLKIDVVFGRKNVLSRIEKIKYLIREGKFKEGDSVLGLAKIKVKKMKKLKKEKVEVKPTYMGE